MTITVAPTRNEYTATAAQTVFTYTFKIFTDTDLNVFVTPAGQEANDTTDQVTPSLVTGVGDANGGTITIPATNLNDLVTIVGDIPANRTTDYQNNGDFRPTVVNNDFDRVVSLVKQVEDIAGRSLSFPESQQNTQKLSLPTPIAGRFLRWNGTVDGLENVEVTTQPIGTNVGSIAGLRALDINNFSAGDSVFVDGYYATGDGNGGPRRILFTGAAPAFYVDDGGYTIVPDGGDGSAAWLWSEVKAVNIDWYGASENVTDNLPLINKAEAFAFSEGLVLVGTTKTYKHDGKMVWRVPVLGLGRRTVFENTSTTGEDAIEIPASNQYYMQFGSFLSKGNPLSGRGLFVNNNNSYLRFNNADFEEHGTHGFHLYASWAGSFNQCKFSSNGGIGVYLEADLAAAVPGGPNSISFFGCEARHNGGANPADTFNTLKGGVRIKGGDVVNWVGGVIEDNHPWGVVVEDTGAVGSSNINLDVYTEFNGVDALVGGTIYIGAYGNKVNLGNSSIRYGSNDANTNYAVFKQFAANAIPVGTTPESFILDKKTTYINIFPSGTNNVKFDGVAFDKPYYLQSELVGDVTGSAVPITHEILTSTPDGQFVCKIDYISVTAGGAGGITRLIAGNAGGAHFAVIMPFEGGTGAPTAFQWVGDSLQVTFPASQFGFLELHEAGRIAGRPGTETPTSFGINSTTFPLADAMRRN